MHDADCHVTAPGYGKFPSLLVSSTCRCCTLAPRGIFRVALVNNVHGVIREMQQNTDGIVHAEGIAPRGVSASNHGWQRITLPHPNDWHLRWHRPCGLSYADASWRRRKSVSHSLPHRMRMASHPYDCTYVSARSWGE